jgi:hypothetical protein
LKKTKNKKLIIWSISIVISILLIVGIFAIYVSDYYHADTDSIEVFIQNKNVNKTVLYDGAISYKTEDSEVGFIFYPGGKVEFTSYEPLMYELALNGITCILLEMPLNLAFFNVNAASKAIDYFPEIESWYIGGHSLGGSIASSYLANNLDKFDGLVLLSSYSTNNLNDEKLKVLSIYGSEDKVMNKENYNNNKKNFPSNFTEKVIEGGCHAFFGMYGAQDGDGIPLITNEEQIIMTSNFIVEFINQ